MRPNRSSSIDRAHLERAGIEQRAEPLRRPIAESCFLGTMGRVCFRGVDVGDPDAGAADPGRVAIDDAVIAAACMAEAEPARLARGRESRGANGNHGAKKAADAGHGGGGESERDLVHQRRDRPWRLPIVEQACGDSAFPKSAERAV